MVNINEVLEGHVALDIECLDRIYLNGYVPILQVGGQVIRFMKDHLGKNIPSPAILEKIGTSFRQSVREYAEQNNIPVVQFKRDDRKIDVMRRYLTAQERTGTSGVVAIGVAQEYQNVFAAYDKGGSHGFPWYSFTKADRRVTCYYFYLWDRDFGGSFIKICSYFPYPIKVWVNGHEWAKRQAMQAGISFTALSNGFASCDDAPALQAICDRLTSTVIQEFFDRWMNILPVPLTEYDREFGYWWELSMRQIETSRTIVFDAPRHARGFFESLVTDNLDLGRPETVELLFKGYPPCSGHGRPIVNHAPCSTKVVTTDTQVSMNVFFKHSRIKQYLKDGRALRIETVINSPKDLNCLRRLEHLEELQPKARDINSRLLDTERVGQGCVLASPAFERVASSSLTADGRRGPAMRFGDPRVMALFGALCVSLTVLGFTHRSLRARVIQLLDTDYTTHQTSYDLHRLRTNGLIQRREHSNSYNLTPDGLRVALFYTKVHRRLLRPLLAADTPPAPIELRQALKSIDRIVNGYIIDARLGTAA
ncbi:hypothetical protein QMG61_05095 [Cryobacterium sp. PH31-AA6]|uniref:hypothetical protein n=1 Tax=Cryobacterium sp. PH31-AA6 TaxID=3046205 RepID=UPI0024B89AEC|nr:hypothetical protein [Cryobacterium sp. PH31-AA6]MDJ0323138.1 hypothetical protein [Cryobacterium sp. PH31-AA6]